MSRIGGFVHIIESPAPDDLLVGRTEGRLLSEALELGEIPFSYSLAADPQMFGQAVGARLVGAWQHLQRLPILHLSMHGNEAGVEFTNKDFLTWDELRRILLPLFRAMQGGLLVCMSSCFGSTGCRMAMNCDNEPHFWALVGNSASATWADAAVAYASFYHLFFKGIPLDACVKAMKIASGDLNFGYYFGVQIQADWNSFVQQRQADIQAALAAGLSAGGS